MVTYSYYLTEYMGEQIEQETFNKLLSRSSAVINYITGDAEETEDIKKATCAEIEYLAINGGVNALNGADKSQFTSEKIGGYSYTKGGNSITSSSLKYISGVPVAPLVWLYLKKGSRGIVVGLE